MKFSAFSYINKREHMEKFYPVVNPSDESDVSLPASGLKVVTKPYPATGNPEKIWGALGLCGGHSCLCHTQCRDQEIHF